MYFPVLFCVSVSGCEDRLQNDIDCVGWDVMPTSLVFVVIEFVVLCRYDVWTTIHIVLWCAEG